MRPAFFWLFFLVLKVPLASAKPLEASKPWIGISIARGSKGVLINGVIKGTPAEKAGFEVGDEILRVDGKPIISSDQLIDFVHAKGVGSALAIDLVRHGKELKKNLRLEVQPDMRDMMRKLYVGNPAPAFEVLALDGNRTIKSESLKGRVVLLEFWATWCPSCRAALPLIHELAKNRKDLVVLALTEEELPDVQEFVAKKDFAFTVVRDPKRKISLDYHVSSVPTFFLIDQEGIVRQVELGAGEYLQNLLLEIDQLLQINK